jgi:hypothetical protein
MQKFLYVLPRAFALLVTAFFAIFILEGFGPGFGWQDSVMHLVLALVVLAITIVAWKWPKIGGWLFVIIALRAASPLMRGDIEGIALLGLVPLLIGILFIREGFAKRSVPPKDAITS